MIVAIVMLVAMVMIVVDMIVVVKMAMVMMVKVDCMSPLLAPAAWHGHRIIRQQTISVQSGNLRDGEKLKQVKVKIGRK